MPIVNIKSVAGNYIRIPKSFLKLKELTHTEVIVLSTISSFNTNGKSYTLGNRGTAEMLNVTEKTANKCLSNLEKKGYISKLNIQDRTQGEYRRNIYEITHMTLDLYQGKESSVIESKNKTNTPTPIVGEKILEAIKPAKNGISYPVKEDTINTKEQPQMENIQKKESELNHEKQEDIFAPAPAPETKKVVEVSPEQLPKMKIKEKKPLTEEQKVEARKKFAIAVTDKLFSVSQIKDEEIIKMTRKAVYNLHLNGKITAKPKDQFDVKYLLQIVDLIMSPTTIVYDTMSNSSIDGTLFRKLKNGVNSPNKLTAEDISLLMAETGLSSNYCYYFKQNGSGKINDFKMYIDKIRGVLDAIRSSYSKELMYSDVRYTGGL